MARVLIVGNVCKDIIYTTATYPSEDTKVPAMSRVVRVGGNAGNILQVLLQVGETQVGETQVGALQLSCLFRVGSCDFSRALVTEFEGKGVHMMGIVQEDTELPESVLINSVETGSRTCVAFRNCTDLSKDEVLCAISDWRVYDWVHLEHRRNGLDVLEVARSIKLRRPQLKISLEIEKIRDGFEEIMSVVDYPIVGKEVCRQLGYHDMESALRGLCVHARHSLVVTWGDKGAGLWFSGGCKNLIFSDKYPTKLVDVEPNIFTCDAVEVKDIVDSTGAGDTFTAGFIHSLIGLGETRLPECLSRACRLAASKLQLKGMVVNPKALS